MLGWAQDSRRVFVMRDAEGEERVFVNPVIVREEGMQLSPDGCLSFPGLPLCTVRPRARRRPPLPYHLGRRAPALGLRAHVPVRRLRWLFWWLHTGRLGGLSVLDTVPIHLREVVERSRVPGSLRGERALMS